MQRPDLNSMGTNDPGVEGHITAGRFAEAVQAASDQFSVSLCDLAVAEFSLGRTESAITKFRDSLELSPGNRHAFHNLLVALQRQSQLRGENLQAQIDFVVRNSKRFPWLQPYRRLIYLPVFLNLEFVAGKCNLKCRMCNGTHSERYPNRLSALSPSDFDQFLAAAPTVAGLTLSSGDSDPMLHPQIEQIIDIARKHGTSLDFYTNGHPLSAGKCASIVESQIVQMINFSIDAATPAMYRRVRGECLTRLIGKIEMLQSAKKERDSFYPWISLSFVAMADNIPELPDFVDLAHRLGAARVLVEDLGGWPDGAGGNRQATENPECQEHMGVARRRAEEAGIQLVLPERFHEPRSADSASARQGNSPEREERLSGEALYCCGWIRGIWTDMDGRLQPCCLVHNVADMGNIKDGPLFRNNKYARVKELLLSGKVFPSCAGQKQCQYVQQQKAAGVPLRFMTADDLGELAPRQPSCQPSTDGDGTTMSLPVLSVT